MSLGEERVRVDFNPGGSPIVQDIKGKTADMIDLLEEMKNRQGKPDTDPRLIALAQTAYEEAAMWAVKAVTGP